MPVIRCTHCGASGNAPEHILGQHVRCSKCKQSFVASSDEGPPASPFSTDPPEDEGFPTEDDIARPPARRGANKPNDDEEEAEDEIARLPIRKSARSSGVADLLMFRRMIAPYLIILLFWLLMAVSILGSLAMIVLGLLNGGREGLAGALVGVVALLIGPIAVRLWCEVLIVVFRINETLTDIRNELHRGD